MKQSDVGYGLPIRSGLRGRYKLQFFAIREKIVMPWAYILLIRMMTEECSLRREFLIVQAQPVKDGPENR
jgi:hypothetical protein